eukprot:m.239972 g.239972  ORF g.239972 m.239972 type:complete len:129 (+) comp22946_c0_seq1:58-444(+)
MGKSKKKKLPPATYFVDRLLARRVSHGVVQYRVKWLGYLEQTWEPEENIPADVVAEFTPPHMAQTKQLMFKCARPDCTKIEIYPQQFQVCSRCLKNSPRRAPRYCSESCHEDHAASHALVCPLPCDEV